MDIARRGFAAWKKPVQDPTTLQDDDLHIPQAAAEDLSSFSDNGDEDATGDLDIEIQELDLGDDNAGPTITEEPTTTQQRSEETAPSRRTTVEDVPDDDDMPHEDSRYIFSCPEELRAGIPIGQG